MIDFGIKESLADINLQKRLLLQLSIQRESMFRSRDFQNL